MDTVTYSDLGLIAGVVAIALLGFWLIGLLVERGHFPRLMRWIVAAALAAAAVAQALDRHWTGAVIFGLGALFYAGNILVSRRPAAPR